MTFYEETYDNFVNDFAKVLREKIYNLELSKLIFLCIGTDKIIGDSFGPLVGYKLKKMFQNKENIEVIGTFDNIISMQNISNIINNIYSSFEEPFVIAIDAALSNKNETGKIIVSRKSMNIGGSFNKSSIHVGNMSIKGIVSKDLKNPKYNFKLLQNTKLRINYENGRYSIKRNI